MPFTYIRFHVKYLDNEWRKETVNIGTYSENRKYAKELVGMFRHFLSKGNILGYTVELVTRGEINEYVDLIGADAAP